MVKNQTKLFFSLPYYIHYLPGILISITASISLYVNHLETIIYTPPDSLWRSVAVFIVIFLGGAVVLYAFIRDHNISGLVAVILISGLFLTIRVFIEFILCIIVAWIAVLLFFRRMDSQQAEMGIMLSSIVLFGYYTATYFGHLIQNSKWDESVSLASPIWEDYTAKASGDTPDIFYIILDGYGGESMLREIHNIENSEFIQELEARGFIVPSDSKSNYPRTILSLASSLNMQYLDSISSSMQDSPLWWPLTGTIMDNETIKYLRVNGYTVANTASNWDYTTLPDAEHVFNPFLIYLNKFEEYQIQQTNLSFLNSIENIGISVPTYSNHRKTVLYALDSMREIAELPSPKFAFVHIVSPHPPFVFDAQGNEVTPDYPFTLSDSKHLLAPPSHYRDGYAEQLKFINQKVLTAVDAILENSKKPPIIIIQGDHGPGIYVEHGSIEKTCLYERYSILNAYYLPGIKNIDIPADISPVNTFRIIFNHYFSENLEILPNRQYFYKEGLTFQFTEVTDRIQPFCSFLSE